jgi:signal transduction histidine kinase
MRGAERKTSTSTSTRRAINRSGKAPQIAGRREVDRFERLVDELSAAMAQTPAEAVDQGVAIWLEKICTALGLDRAKIHEHYSGEIGFPVYQTWVRAGVPPFPPANDPIWATDKVHAWILAGNRLVFSRPSEIPPEFPDAREFVSRYGPKASAIIPMWAGNRIIGGATFGKFRPRKWSPQLLRRLEVAVRIFGSAIERRQAEHAVRAARAELALVQRRSMMAELVGSLAHELNQPLGAIMSNLGGLARLLSQGNPDPALAAKVVENAIEDTRRGSQVIRSIRDMFRQNRIDKAPVDIGELIGEVVELLAGEAATRNVAVEVKSRPRAPSVLGDKILLQQCVLNLVMNAFESTAKRDNIKRSVVIEIRPENSSHVAVSVGDNGIGIDQSVAKKMFQPFVTTKSGGMGLLLVTKSVLDDHGGKVWSRNNDAGGATFTFTLPTVKSKRSDRILTGEQLEAGH